MRTPSLIRFDRSIWLSVNTHFLVKFTSVLRTIEIARINYIDNDLKVSKSPLWISNNCRFGRSRSLIKNFKRLDVARCLFNLTFRYSFEHPFQPCTHTTTQDVKPFRCERTQLRTYFDCVSSTLPLVIGHSIRTK